MKKTVRLNEIELKNIITEAVKRVLKESRDDYDKSEKEVSDDVDYEEKQRMREEDLLKMYFDELNGNKDEYVVSEEDKKSGIHIDPENKGKFTATKKRTGKSTEELTHSKNPLTRKRANFARMSKRGWKPLKKDDSE